MNHFLTYLIETGICLTLLYLAYWLFLRKETYFNFNRLFLVGSLLLSLLVPVFHLNMTITEEGRLSDTASGIMKFRHSYEDLVKMIEADFGAEPGRMHSGKNADRAPQLTEEMGVIPSEAMLKDNDKGKGSSMRNFLQRINISRLILVIYISGVLYFLVRFVYLVIRLTVLAKRNVVTRREGFRIVEIKEDISPFSFFRFLFLNRASFNEAELENVLEHEKAHIMQRHSLDHLFAHGLAVFQWFNPFAWQMRNALKTTHEYIADRQVINKGFELFDYQTILLNQVIGYHSVELVNNFNLKPLKKRIAMMTKNKPGITAKVKATLVLPIAIITFFLFTDFTLKGSEINNMERNTEQKSLESQNDLTGLWVKTSKDNSPEMLMIDKKSISILRGIEVQQYAWSQTNSSIKLNSPSALSVNYKLRGNELILSWNELNETLYTKSDAANALDVSLKRLPLKIELPFLTQYRIMENEEFLCFLSAGIDKNGEIKYFIDGEKVSQNDIGKVISFKKQMINILDHNKFLVILQIDKNVPMGEVNKIKEALISISQFRYADAGYPHGDRHSVSPLIFDKVALPRILPPPEAKMLDIEQLEKEGRPVLLVDLSKRNTNPAELEAKISSYIKQNKGNYIISLQYDKQIPYDEYIVSSDMIFNVVYKFRDQLAKEKYGVSYGELGDALQKEIRKEYPVSISEMTVN